MEAAAARAAAAAEAAEEARMAEEEKARESQLRDVFHAFDFDDEEGVGPDEIFAIGEARAKLTGKGEWTAEKQKKMMRRIQDEDGNVDEGTCGGSNPAPIPEPST